MRPPPDPLYLSDVMRTQAALLALALSCGGSSQPAEDPAPRAEPSAAPAPADPPSADELVDVSLVADVSAIAPGQELTLGARMTIEDGWHVYWTNPGDSGLATELAVTAPDGFEVGAPRFPGPQRFDLPGGLVNYGYDRELLLLVPVVAPDPLPEGELRFAAEASFLACREACLRGAGSATLALPAAGPEAPSSPSHPELFARYRARLPVPLADQAAAEWRRSEGQRTLVLRFAGADDVSYFPAPDEPLVGVAAVPSGDATALHLSYAGDASAGERGVIAVTTDGATRFYQNDVSWEN